MLRLKVTYFAKIVGKRNSDFLKMHFAVSAVRPWHDFFQTILFLRASRVDRTQLGSPGDQGLPVAFVCI